MTNLKLCSKMHVMVIVSSVLIAVGIAVGLICQFVAGGYFNYGDDYKSYKSVEVSYAFVDFSDEDNVKDICDEAFKNAKISYFESSYGDTSLGGELVFKFSKSVKNEKLEAVAQEITQKLNVADTGLSNASFHEVETQLGSEKALVYGAIAVASAVVFQFIYFAVRYKLTMAFAALLADVHNLGIFVSLLVITRLPVGSAAVAFAVLTVLMTMIGCCFYFDRVRKNAKNEVLSKLDSFELCDLSVRESFSSVCVSAVGFAVACLLVFVLLSISALSVVGVLAPVFCALFAAAANIYGTLFFTPSVYSRFKRIGDGFKADRAAKVKKS